MTAAIVSVELNAMLLFSILREGGGVPAWNRFVGELFSRNLITPSWSMGETPPPIDIGLDFSRAYLGEMNLDGIDLRSCCLDEANLDEASLRGAQIGPCRGATFRGAILEKAEFICDIDGCNFAGAVGLETVRFTDASYDPADPPKGLPAEILAHCKTNAGGQPSTYVPDLSVPGECAGYARAQLGSQASVLFLQIGE